MTTRFTKSPAAAAACAVILSVSGAGAAVSFTPGDILMGFQASGGTGAGSTYVFNLGQGSSYRDNAAAGPVNNIGTDLVATFGAAWFSRTDLAWGIGGVRTNAGFGSAALEVINGDSARTLYVSQVSPGISASAGFDTFNATFVTLAATEMMDTQSGFQTTNTVLPRDATPASDNLGVVQGTGDINNWSAKVDAAPWGIFPGSVEGSFGTGNSLAYLDLYRILGRNDLPGTAEPAPVGQSVYQTTFTINAAGDISAVPEPSGAVLLAACALAPLLRRRRPQA